jgi:hypothetical protein
MGYLTQHFFVLRLKRKLQQQVRKIHPMFAGRSPWVGSCKMQGVLSLNSQRKKEPK